MKKTLILTAVLILSCSGIHAQKSTQKKVSSKVATSDRNEMGKIQSLPILGTIDLPMSYDGLHTPFYEVLKQRATNRNMREEDIPMELLSSLLWCAYGFNRPDEAKRVVPSAINAQEYDIYVFTKEGVYLYNAQKNALDMVAKDDLRSKISQQKFFSTAPVAIVLVANYDRMTQFKKVEDRDFYAAVDAGYISQNIYLGCASANLNTVACGLINRDIIHELLGITNGRAMLAHPVGIK